MANNDEVELPDLARDATAGDKTALLQNDGAPDGEPKHSSADLEAVFDVPVTVSAVLGKSGMEVSQPLKLSKGTIVELDRKVLADLAVHDMPAFTAIAEKAKAALPAATKAA